MFNVRKRRLETAEFGLLVACCRQAFGPAGARVIPALPADLNWWAFLHLARRHRVQGLVWRSLHPSREVLPWAIAEALAAEAGSIARNGMAEAAESARLLDALNAAGVPLLFIKGLPLARLAYGDPFVKMAWDIDILVPRKQLATAAEVLASADYDLVIPQPWEANKLQRWHDSRKESVWRKRAANIHVELHTRLADNPLLLDGVSAGAPRQFVDVAPGVTLPTLATEELFAYLCVHGASSAWFRLKWLADLAALIESFEPDHISQLYRRSQELGAARAAGQALLLARDFFGTALEPALALALESDGAIRRLASMAWRQMAASAEPTKRRFGTATIHWTQLLLRRELRFKISEMRRQLSDAAGNLA